jgi:acetylornithine deacetylase/succinyl-diaminopimelate desuccinylase-like protein
MNLQHNFFATHDDFTDDRLYHDAINLLRDMIATPSFSGNESFTATLIQCFLRNRDVKVYRKLHNVWAFNLFYDAAKPTILLNSHHDTARPDPGYSLNPFHPHIVDNKLYGLGSNNAGGCVVAMLAAFLHFYNRHDLQYNLCYAATAEKETSGDNGLKLMLPELEDLHFAIIGEPTAMAMGVSEICRPDKTIGQSTYHDALKAALSTGCKIYKSAITPDQALLNVPAVVIGPGSGNRRSISDEYIYLSEIQQGIKLYITLLEHMALKSWEL